jgi:hypothetical protein
VRTDAELANGGLDPLDDLLGHVAVGAYERGGELVTADAPEDVARARVDAERLGHEPERLVADGVSPAVVDGLEGVDVEGDQGDVVDLAARPLELGAERLVEGAVVGEPGQGVGEREALKSLVAALQRARHRIEVGGDRAELVDALPAQPRIQLAEGQPARDRPQAVERPEQSEAQHQQQAGGHQEPGHDARQRDLAAAPSGGGVQRMEIEVERRRCERATALAQRKAGLQQVMPVLTDLPEAHTAVAQRRDVVALPDVGKRRRVGRRDLDRLAAALDEQVDPGDARCLAAELLQPLAQVSAIDPALGQLKAARQRARLLLTGSQIGGVQGRVHLLDEDRCERRHDHRHGTQDAQAKGASTEDTRKSGTDAGHGPTDRSKAPDP